MGVTIRFLMDWNGFKKGQIATLGTGVADVYVRSNRAEYVVEDDIDEEDADDPDTDESDGVELSLSPGTPKRRGRPVGSKSKEKEY